MSNLAYVVLSYNHPGVTESCLNSLLQHRAGPLFLVHNGSTIENRKYLKERFPEVQHLELEANLGFTGGANFGMRSATSAGFDWIVFVTNDCHLQKVGTLPSKPGLFAPKIYRRTSGKVDSLGGGFDPNTGRIWHTHSPTEWEALSTKGYRQYVPATAFLIHRQVIEMTGGFDESLHTYWEDVDLGQRLKPSLKLGALTDWEFRHSVGKTCHGNSLYTLYYFQRNRIRVSLRYASKWCRPLIALRLRADLLRRALRLIEKGRGAEVRHLWRAAAPR